MALAHSPQQPGWVGASEEGARAQARPVAQPWLSWKGVGGAGGVRGVRPRAPEGLGNNGVTAGAAPRVTGTERLY